MEHNIDVPICIAWCLISGDLIETVSEQNKENLVILDLSVCEIFPSIGWLLKLLLRNNMEETNLLSSLKIFDILIYFTCHSKLSIYVYLSFFSMYLSSYNFINLPNFPKLDVLAVLRNSWYYNFIYNKLQIFLQN